MKRNGLVLAVVVIGISMLLWAGWHNLRERRIAMQRAQENRVTLTKDGSTQKDDDSTQLQLDLRGKPAPGFTLVDLANGKKVSLRDYKGKAVLVNFWATWCAPCKLEMPWFEAFRNQYASQGFEILGIAEDDAGKDEIGKAVKKIGVTYPILLTDGKVAPLYGGVDYLPMTFYVDRTGTVVQETAGLASKDEVEANIRKIIASTAPTATTASGRQVKTDAAGGE